MNKLKENILKWYYSLAAKEKLILSISILVILIIFYLIFIKDNYRENEINYKNLTSKEIIETSEITYDRNILASLDEVLVKIFKVKNSKLIIKNKTINMNKLYQEAISNNYKKCISKSKFKNKLSDICENTLNKPNDELNFLKSNIKCVYFSAKYDMYLIEINLINDVSSYIGIRVKDNTYTIVYIE